VQIELNRLSADGAIPSLNGIIDLVNNQKNDFPRDRHRYPYEMLGCLLFPLTEIPAYISLFGKPPS
jgi:hypothetical protein